MAETPPWAATEAGLSLAVRLTPRAGRDRIGEIAVHDGRAVLRVAVTAPPVEGAANAALTRLVARSLGVAKSDVEIAAGATGRVKTLRIAGDAARLAARLAEIAGAAARP